MIKSTFDLCLPIAPLSGATNSRISGCFPVAPHGYFLVFLETDFPNLEARGIFLEVPGDEGFLVFIDPQDSANLRETGPGAGSPACGEERN